jgi:hypothetical protein
MTRKCREEVYQNKKTNENIESANFSPAEIYYEIQDVINQKYYNCSACDKLVQFFERKSCKNFESGDVYKEKKAIRDWCRKMVVI